ncbi:hypothetical protein GCM10010384_53930 [Streptomyces djakartensis]|uniref:Uncharacterized protein n=1 Tax=Streptomyces djakartensis TaxID=68193 RepID=A0ABQ3AAN2_9ACTN|nr:hypothetical protein GCM10010384_53930 [Streptomyces djakartensis]
MYVMAKALVYREGTVSEEELLEAFRRVTGVTPPRWHLIRVHREAEDQWRADQISCRRNHAGQLNQMIVGSVVPPFQPYWFAVPVPRPLFAEDGSPALVCELVPGTWYLALEQRGPNLVTQTADGRRGVLTDVSGVQKGA